jgi:hypothetical protein
LHEGPAKWQLMTVTGRSALIALVVLVSAASHNGTIAAPQVRVPPPATDSSFYALMRTLVRDSLWAGEPGRTPARYFAVDPAAIRVLRAAGIPVDSTHAARFVGCEGQRGPGNDATNGYVLSVSFGQEMAGATTAVHLTVGCKMLRGDSVSVTGHYCGWDLLVGGSRLTASGEWRVLRSRRCWRL